MIQLLLGFLVAISSSAKEVAVNAEEVHPLLVGQSVPEVKVQTAKGKAQSLQSVLKKKPSVVVFFRGGWCPYCSLQLKELKDSVKPLQDLGYQLIAISPDKPAELKNTISKNSLDYELYSDSSADAAKAFGIAFKVDDETVAKYKTFNIDLEKASGNKNQILPVPSVFLVSKEGVVLFQYVNPNYKVRLHREILLAAAKAFVPKNQIN